MLPVLTILISHNQEEFTHCKTKIGCLKGSRPLYKFQSMFSFIIMELSSEFGCREKAVIAPSGFDKSIWDPSCDNFLPQSYSADDMKGKSVCKVELQRHLDLHEGASKILVSIQSIKYCRL